MSRKGFLDCKNAADKLLKYSNNGQYACSLFYKNIKLTYNIQGDKYRTYSCELNDHSLENITYKSTVKWVYQTSFTILLTNESSVYDEHLVYDPRCNEEFDKKDFKHKLYNTQLACEIILKNSQGKKIKIIHDNLRFRKDDLLLAKKLGFIWTETNISEDFVKTIN